MGYHDYSENRNAALNAAEQKRKPIKEKTIKQKTIKEKKSKG